MATHSSIVAWRMPWTEEPGGYSPWGLRVGHDRATKHRAGRGPLTQDDWRPLKVTRCRHGAQGQRALRTCPVLWGNGKRLDSEMEAESAVLPLQAEGHRRSCQHTSRSREKTRKGPPTVFRRSVTLLTT